MVSFKLDAPLYYSNINNIYDIKIVLNSGT